MWYRKGLDKKVSEGSLALWNKLRWLISLFICNESLLCVTELAWIA